MAATLLHLGNTRSRAPFPAWILGCGSWISSRKLCVQKHNLSLSANISNDFPQSPSFLNIDSPIFEKLSFIISLSFIVFGYSLTNIFL
jgi:hypothetical protein